MRVAREGKQQRTLASGELDGLALAPCEQAGVINDQITEGEVLRLAHSKSYRGPSNRRPDPQQATRVQSVALKQCTLCYKQIPEPSPSVLVIGQPESVMVKTVR
jgi:hypothetical protein